MPVSTSSRSSIRCDQGGSTSRRPLSGSVLVPVVGHHAMGGVATLTLTMHRLEHRNRLLAAVRTPGVPPRTDWSITLEAGKAFPADVVQSCTHVPEPLPH